MKGRPAPRISSALLRTAYMSRLKWLHLLPWLQRQASAVPMVCITDPVCLATMQEVYQGPTFKEIIGAAVGIASGEAAGALEINHPGAICWGAGLADGDPLKSVTPDFSIGDKVGFLLWHTPLRKLCFPLSFFLFLRQTAEV